MENRRTKAVGLMEFEKLRALSARLGRDPMLVQAAGGNTSLKEDGVMWIKASGTWLMHAAEKDIFVPLDIRRIAKALSEDDPDCESCLPFVRQDLNTSSLRPSIETSVHGLMPQTVVLHVHCVSTIAWAIQPDAEAQLQKPLASFNWAFVPYARPGLQLSRAIRQAIKPDTEVLILGNHGLAVAAATVDEAENLLTRVVQALRRPARNLPKADLKRLSALAAGTKYRLPVDKGAHDFALDPWAHAHGGSNVYYPDHVVFLGTEVPGEMSSNAAAIAIYGAGVLVRKDAKSSIEPMLRCLGDVFRRIEPGSALKALTANEIDQLINWDAEKYRQTLKS
jgi:rhamnose utilization protein RhaD (predicted bifunctional aldolase and dehydrogenase)